MDYTNNIYKLYIIKIAKWFMLTVPILMLYYKDTGLTIEESFRIKAIYSIAIVIFEIPSGYIADFWGRKNSIILGSILGTVGFAIYSFFSGFYSFLAAELVLGIGMSFISGSDSALLYDSLATHNRQSEYTKYEGYSTAVGNFSEAISASLGGLLAGISLQTPFYFQTAVAFIGIPASFALTEPKVVKQIAKSEHSQILKILFTSLKETGELKWNILYSSIMGAATLTMAWIYQLYLNDLKFSTWTIGVVATVLNFTTAITTAISFKIEKRFGALKTVLFLTVFIIGGFLVPGFWFSTAFLFFLFMFYFARGIATPVLKDYVNQSTPNEIRATVLSVRAFFVRIVFSALAPLIGWFSDNFTLVSAFRFTGLLFLVLCLISLVGYYPYLKKSDAERKV